MSSNKPKIPVTGFVASADISTAAEIPLTDKNETTVTIGASDRLVVQGVSMACNPTTGAVVLTLYHDTDDDNAIDSGEEIVASIFEGSNVYNSNHDLGSDGHRCPLGAKPHVLGSAAAVARVSISGYVERG